MTGSKSSVSIVFCLIVTALSLNFFTKPAACPLRYADGEMHANVCDCCARYHDMEGHCHSVFGKAPGICCARGMCHITKPGVEPSHVKGSSTIDLQLSTFAYVPPTDVWPLRPYNLKHALLLLGEEKERPPEAS
jgi:hypothetical protein